MAQAVKEVFPTAQLTIGPALEESFYYDFAFDALLRLRTWKR